MLKMTVSDVEDDVLLVLVLMWLWFWFTAYTASDDCTLRLWRLPLYDNINRRTVEMGACVAVLRGVPQVLTLLTLLVQK